MKSLKSSLLRKIVMGYKIAKKREHATFEPYSGKKHEVSQSLQLIQRASPPEMLNIEEIAQAFKIPPPTVGKIYNKIKELETNLPEEPSKEIDMNIFKSKIENLEKTAISSGVYVIPEITNLIIYTKGKIHDLELASTPEIDPAVEVKKQLEELGREKKILEDAKKTVMEKYYNREIDESSIKNIMDNYEQRLVETDVRIKNLNDALPSLAKEGKLSGKQKEKLMTTRGVTRPPSPFTPEPGEIFPAQKLPLQFSKMFKPKQTTSPATQPPSSTAVQKTEEVRVPESQGFEIPQISKAGIKIGSLETEEETPSISLVYPLIPRSPQKNEPVFAYAQVFWDGNANTYVYQLVEPKLTEKLIDVYKKVKEMLEQKLDIDFSRLKKIEAKDFLDKQIDDVLNYFNFTVTENEKRILKYYMNRDFTGLEMIEPIIQDPNIEDISCDGVGIPIFVFHRNPEIGSVATNVTFNNSEELDSFIIRLAQLCGKSISVSQPLLDGTLPDGSRIQATLGTDIARRGSNFTIRKFTEEPLTPVHLLNYATLDVNLLAYLWFVVDYGRSILVSGGTASGKTSLLNVLSLFIRPEKKIVSIEDTAELRLPHSHWVPVVARTAIGEEGRGEVDMFELLRESLRQRPDYIVVGEVRGKEAYILFQQMATGHPSIATIHAENIARLIDRLTTPPISLPAGLISTLDVVVFLARMKYKNKFIRKVAEVVEIVDFDTGTNRPVINKIFKWNPQNDKFEVANKSISLKKISDLTGVSEKDIKNEIQRRIAVLEWMRENNILDYRDVHQIFSIYYTDPERLLSYIQGAG